MRTRLESGQTDRYRPLLGEVLLKYDNARRNSIALLGVGVLWAVAAPFTKGEEILWLWFGPPASFLVISVFLSILAWRTKLKITKLEPHCKGALEIGPLMIAADRGGDFDYLPNVARRVLLDLLPRVTREDAILLGRREHQWMHHQMKIATRENIAGDRFIVKAVLAALSEVGTDADVPFVEKLANKHIKDHFQEAGAAWLPAIRECAISIRNETTLLRASHDPEHALLRPARPIQDEAVLLRPTSLEVGEPPQL